MIEIRYGRDRGAVNLGWLDSRHSFSFGSYYDRDRMGFSSLRVINEDKVAPGQGFATHGHKDMEIITYVLSGSLEHKDSLGNGSIMYPGDVQRMSAGTGILHSEFNPSASEPGHFLQIWILPAQRDLPPSYEQVHFSPESRQGQLHLIASQTGQGDAVTVHQEVQLYSALLAPGQSVTYAIAQQRAIWVQVARGAISLEDHFLVAGDAAAVTDLEAVTIAGQSDDAELLLFDLAAES
jgi:redox-sensitive bicupin YhaK (pirin superfamily)